jgi:competence protein ComEC
MQVCLLVIHFWQNLPALLYGTAFLFGLYAHLAPSIWMIIPCAFLWIPFLIYFTASKTIEALKPFILSILIFITGWCYAGAQHSFPNLPKEGIQGTAFLKIHHFTTQHSFFGDQWVYRCEILQFFPDGSQPSIASSLPCIITFSADREAPAANQEYSVPGKLIKTKQGSYRLNVSSKAIWHPIPNTWSLSQERYKWKKRVGEWIESKYSHPLSGSFLAGLATGEFDDYWMRQQFARFGLQHLLAISGFHFAIIAAFLSVLLRLFLSHRVHLASLLLCLTGYCIFLGPQASILRAWTMCSLTVLGGLIEKQTTALNSLGFALLGILGYNPLLSLELGFQLSFATTAAILLFYQPALAWLNEVLTKRPLSEVVQMNGWHQHGYCLFAFFRQGLALTLAVNIFALPLTLYIFHQFPWMSLLYNLFFPFLASASLCLLLLGGALSFVPYLPSLIHSLNDSFTFFLLQLTPQVPTEMDAILTLESLHSGWLISYLCCAALAGILLKEKGRENKAFQFI